MTPTRLLPLLLCTLLLQACVTPAAPTAVQPELPFTGDSSRFGPRPAVPAPDDLHRLPPEAEAAFLAYFNHPSRAQVGAQWRVYQYLENIVNDYQYQPETRTAAETLAHKGGNCMSLAILTTALARLGGVQIGYQLMDDQPVFEYQGSVVIKGVHISSLVYNPEWVKAAGTPEAFTMSPGMRIDYFPELRGRFLANIDEPGYLAMYYSNIASDAIARNDYATAYWYLLEALQQAPTNGAALNMLAVVNGRVGDLATAETIYQFGIAHAEDKLSLLKNYHSLLVAGGRDADADRIQRQLDTMNDPSPLHWLRLARESHARGDWPEAIRFYRRVLEIAPYMHEVHLGLAQSYHASGELGRAEDELVAAVGLASRISTRNLYKAKLLSLQQGN